MKINYGLKTFKLVLQIFNVTYFLAVFWFIFCDIVDDIMDHNHTGEIVDFKIEYELEIDSVKYTHKEQVLVGVYYMFTTLSTVGFGDMSPQTSHEMIVCAIIMFFGVAIFALVMSQFLEIIETFKKIDEEIGDGDLLEAFFDLLRKMNGGQLFNVELQHMIEDHFDYRWKNDKNAAIDDNEEKALLEQLPASVQDLIYTDFLFQNFLQKFRLFFRIVNGS